MARSRAGGGTKDNGHEAALVERERLSRAETELCMEALAHDVRNSVQGIYGNLYLLLELAPEPEARELVLSTLAQAERIARCVRNITRITKLRDAPAPELVRRSLVELVHEAARQTAVNFPGRETRLTIESDGIVEGKDVVEIEPNGVEIILNLIANAVEHNESSIAEITLKLMRCEREGRAWFSLGVEDHGCAVPDEIKASLYDPWNLKTIGVGLSATKMMCSRIGAEIAVEDRIAGYPDQGTRFTVYFPDSTAGAARS
jgi:signal transduction histidine kinase